MPLEKVPNAFTKVTVVFPTRSALASVDPLENCLNQRSTFAWTAATLPRPEMKEGYIAGGTSSTGGTDNCAFRMGEAGTTHPQVSGRVKTKLPTVNSTGSAALAAATRASKRRTRSAGRASERYSNPRQASQERAINM